MFGLQANYENEGVTIPTHHSFKRVKISLRIVTEDIEKKHHHGKKKLRVKLHI